MEAQNKTQFDKCVSPCKQLLFRMQQFYSPSNQWDQNSCDLDLINTGCVCIYLFVYFYLFIFLLGSLRPTQVCDVSAPVSHGEQVFDLFPLSHHSSCCPSAPQTPTWRGTWGIPLWCWPAPATTARPSTYWWEGGGSKTNNDKKKWMCWKSERIELHCRMRLNEVSFCHCLILSNMTFEWHL